MAESVQVTIAEAMTRILSRRGKSPVLGEEGVRLISAINIKGGRIDQDHLRFVPFELYDDWMPEKLRIGDVLLTSEAPLGEVAYIGDDKPLCIGQRLFALRGCPELVHGRFLYYLIGFGDPHREMLERATGSTVGGIRLSELLKVTLELPSLSEQRAISDVLGALDDKIDSNQRKIAKAGELMHLEFLASTVSGSRKGSLGEVLTELRSKVGGDSASVVVLSALAEGQLVVSDDHFKKKVYSAEIGKYLKVPQWAFAYNPSRINIGSIGLNSSTTVGAVSPVYVVAQAQTSAVARWVEQALRTGNVKDQIVAYSSGSVRQVLRYADFASIQLDIPSDEALSGFEDRTLILYELVDAATRETNSLLILRDTLLPELLSGRLRVKDAESMMENV